MDEQVYKVQLQLFLLKKRRNSSKRPYYCPIAITLYLTHACNGNTPRQLWSGAPLAACVKIFNWLDTSALIYKHIPSVGL